MQANAAQAQAEQAVAQVMSDPLLRGLHQRAKKTLAEDLGLGVTVRRERFRPRVT